MGTVLPPTARELEGELGDALRALRRSRQLTQAELAQTANVALGTIKHLEAGAGSNTASLLKVLAALGRADWVQGVAPPAAAFNPLQLLEARRAETERSAKASRVRHARKRP